jgi:hypothetical protein
MKPDRLSTIASLLTVLLLSLHLADDIVRGYEEGVLWNLIAIPIVVLWLYGALVLGDRQSGRLITLVFSLLATGVPIIHFQGAKGFAGWRVAGTSGATFFVWTLLAIGITALLGFLLSARGLWRGLRSRDPA